MAFLAAIPRWAYASLLVLVLMAGGGWWLYSAGKAETQALWDADKGRLQAVGSKAAATQRTIETKDSTDKEANHETVNADLAAARTDAAGARAAYKRLQSEYADYLRARAASAYLGPVAGEPPAREADVLSADLLGRLGQRATELAGYADAARIAGASCEREYAAVKGNR